MKYDGTTFGHQCDALTMSGEQCKNTNQSISPTKAGLILTHDVHLCRRHRAMWERMHRANSGKAACEMKRLPLRDGGFLGGWNRHDYGSMVTATETVDWDAPGAVAEIPAKWVRE